MSVTPVPVLPWSYSAKRPQAGTSSSIEDAPALFKPMSIRSVTLKNRIVVSPMCTYSAENGVVNDWHIGHYAQLAIGGASLIIVEATGVQARGRITPYCLGLWNDDQIADHARLVRVMQSQGCVAGIQLAHSGRKASCHPPFFDCMNELGVEESEGGWPADVVGPSAIPWNDGWIVPRALTIDEIHEIQADWVKAAQRADQAGYTYLEIHSAHGYLNHSFLSAYSNHRTDQYGGSFENRTRFLVELTKLVRAAWPADKPLAVRLSCSDWIDTEDGWTIEQTIKLVNLLIQCGVDVIDTSSGGNAVNQKFSPVAGETHVANDYQTKFGAQIKAHYGEQVLVGPVGRIRDGVTANELITSGQADFVHIGREFLRDPHFVSRAAKDLNHHVWMCPQYEYCAGTAHGDVKRKR